MAIEKTFTADAVLQWQASAPTMEMTFSDLIIEVAEVAGIAYYGASGDEAAQVPGDAHSLALCKKVVNTAIRMFISDGPPNGWRWMRKIARITLNPGGDGPDNLYADPARYLLPLFFQGNINGQISYGQNTNTGAIIDWVDEAFLRDKRSVVAYTGYPRWAAVLPSATGRQWELQIYPTPSQGHVLTFPWTVAFDKLVNLTDVSPAGMKYDHSILSACLARAEMDIENMQRTGFIAQYYQIDLPAAHKLDGQGAPRRIGNLNTGRDKQTRIWNQITYSDYNGTSQEV